MRLAAGLKTRYIPYAQTLTKMSLETWRQDYSSYTCLKKNDTHKSNGFWMPLRSAAISRVLGLGFPPPLNPAAENATSALRTDTDSNAS